jgi:hypothetical protein
MVGKGSTACIDVEEDSDRSQVEEEHRRHTDKEEEDLGCRPAR